MTLPDPISAALFFSRGARMSRSAGGSRARHTGRAVRLRGRGAGRARASV